MPTLFFVTLCERVANTGTSTRVHTNAMKQGTVSRQFVTVGHSTVSHTTEFDVHVETGISLFHDSMKLVGATALESYLEANEQYPMTYGRTFASNP